MAWFYEIRNSNNTLLKRDGGFATQDSARIAGRADAKKIKKSHQPGMQNIGTMKVGQNAEMPTRYRSSFYHLAGRAKLQRREVNSPSLSDKPPRYYPAGAPWLPSYRTRAYAVPA
jgi:hypothetical protein